MVCITTPRMLIQQHCSVYPGQSFDLCWLIEITVDNHVPSSKFNVLHLHLYDLDRIFQIRTKI
jgi:hypothetical protein